MSAVCSYRTTVNAARKAGDLDALDALQDAMAQARRSAIDTHTSTDSESVAEAAMYDAWRRAQDYPEGSTS